MVKKIIRKSILLCLILSFVMIGIMGVYAAESALTEDEAYKIAEEYWDYKEGDVDEDSGFELAIFNDGVTNKDGRDFYAFRLRWFVDNSHWSTVDFLYIDSVTKKCYPDLNSVKIEEPTTEEVKVYPSISTADGIEVSLSTDKEEYVANDIITISYEIKNNNEYNVENIDITLDISEKLELIEGENVLTDISVEAGKSFTGTLNAKYKVIANTESETQKNEAVQTGDSSDSMIFVVIIALSSCIISYMIITRNKKAGKFFAMFIATTILVQSADFSVFAKADELKETREINLERKIKVNNEDCSIKLKVGYDYVVEKGSLSIDVSEFSYNKEGNIYEIASEISGIKGTLKKAENYDKLTLNVYNQKNVLVYTAEIIPSEEWKFENVGLFAGENKIEVIAEGKDKLVEQIMLEDYFGYNFDKIPNSDVDTDKDGLSDMLEEYAGTDINDVDTDDDGVTDCQEIVDIGTSALKSDTDGNGVSDYDEDADNDGIVNGEEYTKGISPISDDTDLDGLKDKEELEQYLTNPALDDTDSDGGKDKWEIDNGYDPLVANETFEIEKRTEEVSEYNSVSASVSLELSNGDVESLEVKKLSVTDNPFVSSTVAGYLGNAYDFTVDGEFSEAQISFEYDTNLGVIGEDFQPRIYYFNETEMTYEELPNQLVENGKVTVTVTHFSTYILLNKTEFDKVWNEEIKAPVVDGEGNQAKNIDIAFVCDISGSMDSYNRINIAKDSINKFIDALETDDRGALVEFDDMAYLKSNFTNDKEYLKTKVNEMYAWGGTAIYTGFGKALEIFDEQGIVSNYKMMIILTDGHDNYSTYEDNYKHLVEKAVDNNIVVYTIGVGSNVNSSILRTVADNTNGKYYNATYADEITDQFKDIRGETVDLTTDTNNDGIADYFTEKIKSGELVLSNGSKMLTGVDFSGSADFDGDGLKNGEEISIKAVNGRVYIVMKSDPRFKDGDNDGVFDKEEIERGTDPLKASYNKTFMDMLLDADRTGENFRYYYEASAYELETNIWDEGIVRLNAVIHGVNANDQVSIYEAVLLENLAQNAENINIEELTLQKMLEEYAKIVDNAVETVIKENVDAADKVSNTVTSIYKIYDELSQVKDKSMFVELGDKLCGFLDDKVKGVKISVEIKDMKISKVLNTGMIIDGLEKASAVKKVYDYVYDVNDKLDDLSEIKANIETVNYSIETLEYLYYNTDDLLLRQATYNVIENLHGQYSNYIQDALTKVVEVAFEKIVEGLASFMTTGTLYLAIIKGAIAITDVLLGTEEEVEQRFQNVAYAELTEAYIGVLDKLIYDNGNGYYEVYEGNEIKAEYYLTCIAQIRISGEKHFYEVYKCGGVLGGLFNWIKDTDNAKEVLNDNIKQVIAEATILGLYLAEQELIN